jgi:hypothetical protein
MVFPELAELKLNLDGWINVNVGNLSVHIVDLIPEGSPRRKLVLNCRVTNPASCDICILDVWVDVIAINGLRLAAGRLFHSMHNRVDPAIIEAGGNGFGAFHIELPACVLQHIEERRAGGDVKLQFLSRVLICEVSKVDDVKILGVPFETTFESDSTDRFEYKIPESDWIKILKSLAWSELEIVELPSSKLRSVPALARALKRFEDAQECYRQGDWEETMLNCRKAFEAIVQDATGTDDMSRANQAFVSLIGEGEKAHRLTKVAKSLDDFLHLGRHENLPNISIKRGDSQLALQLTGALLTYLGQQ